jgi:hypothetical protein
MKKHFRVLNSDMSRPIVEDGTNMPYFDDFETVEEAEQEIEEALNDPDFTEYELTIVPVYSKE